MKPSSWHTERHAVLCLKAKDDMLLENEWTSAKVFGCTKMKLKLTGFWVDLDE